MARRNLRRSRENRGQIEIFKAVFDQFCKVHPRFDHYRQDYEYRNGELPVYLPAKRFTPEELQSLLEIVEKSSSSTPSLLGQLRGHIEVLTNPKGKDVSTLPILESAILGYLRKGIIKGWIFQKQGDYLQPMLVESVEYLPPEVEARSRIPARTRMECYYWARGKGCNETFTWYMEDLEGGKTADEALLNKGLLHETKETVEQYLKDEAIFLEWRKSMGKQFLAKGSFEYKDIGEDDYWGKTRKIDMNGHRVVVDDKCPAIENRRDTAIFTTDDDNSAVDPEKAEKYTRLPLQMEIWCFHLDAHQSGWIQARHLTPYVYNPKVREKLILPDEHQDLIDALTSDMDILMEDIVTGKSGGTTIICQGKAGTGKTLTAEVYAEVVGRPLYRVHSGQLGIEAEGVEAVLKQAMERSKRWGAILLIDEADVFIMQRGEDLARNAVCGVFLRLMEYFDGLMFLTTNRLDAIDDAILSRCIAQIKFEVPGQAEREKLWVSLGQTFGLKLIDKKGEAKKLASEFEATGRDIKGLIRLAIKYARQRKKEVRFEDIKRMATFRGL